MNQAVASTKTDLLARVSSVAPLLGETAAQSENERRLCPAAIDALHNAGLFGVWVPGEVGGFDAGLVEQTEVMIAVAHADMSACWTMMIGNTVTGVLASSLPDAGLADVFAGERLPVAAGSLKPSGKALRVDGGYRVTGKWGFGSGIHHSSWISANCMTQVEGQPRPIALAVPISQVEVFDDWHVAGLCGSGSSSYAVDDVYVPDTHVLSPTPLRGSTRNGYTRLRIPLEHASVSLGGARRALDETAAMAAAKHRLVDPQSVSEKQSFQVELGKLEAQWHTLRAGVLDGAEALEDAIKVATQDDGASFDPTQVSAVAARLRGVCAYATESALVIGGRALRYAGAGAVLSDHPLQRIYRDLTVSAQHVMVSDESYEALGKIALEQ